jgi:RNA polymerase sigma-70 factor, ECF subfamily
MKPPKTDPSELDLLQKINSGDQVAMRDFFELHSNTVYRYVFSRSNDQSIASDILNTVMMEVWNHADRFEGRSKVSTWLIGIARFKMIDYFRKEQRHGHDELDESTIDPTAVSETLIEATQNEKGVKSCIDKLAGVQKEIVQLTFYSEMAYQEIAEVINCPVGTVKSRMYHAKESLKRCLESFLGEENTHAFV